MNRIGENKFYELTAQNRFTKEFKNATAVDMTIFGNLQMIKTFIQNTMNFCCFR